MSSSTRKPPPSRLGRGLSALIPDAPAPADSAALRNLPIEALYTFAPVIIVAVFFYHTVTSQNNVLERVDNPDHTVEVIGSKWQWAFNYMDEDATQGENVYDYGTPQDPAQLWLPVDETVRFKLKSPDVIHSFWIPEFYFKMDVVPGKVMSTSLAGKKTEVKTVEGGILAIDATSRGVMVDNANVVSADVVADNGVIHVIDTVLMPN